MADYEKVRQQIQTLIENSNNITGKFHTNLTDGVNALIEGFGQGGNSGSGNGSFDNEIARLYTKGEYITICFGVLGEAGIGTPIYFGGDSVTGFYEIIEN